MSGSHSGSPYPVAHKSVHDYFSAFAIVKPCAWMKHQNIEIAIKPCDIQRINSNSIILCDQYSNRVYSYQIDKSILKLLYVMDNCTAYRNRIVFNEQDNCLYIWSERKNKFILLDIDTNTLRQSTNCTVLHVATLNAEREIPLCNMVNVNGNIHLFGGPSSNHHFYLNTQENELVELPEIDRFHSHITGASAIYVPQQQNIYMIGGYNTNVNLMNGQVIVYDAVMCQWNRIGSCWKDMYEPQMAVTFDGNYIIIVNSPSTEIYVMEVSGRERKFKMWVSRVTLPHKGKGCICITRNIQKRQFKYYIQYILRRLNMILPIDTINLIWMYCVKEVLNWIHPKLDYSEHWTILISDILKSMTPYWLLPPPTQEKDDDDDIDIDDNIDSFDEEQEDIDDDDTEYHQFDQILIHRKIDIMTLLIFILALEIEGIYCVKEEVVLLSIIFKAEGLKIKNRVMFPYTDESNIHFYHNYFSSKWHINFCLCT